MAKIVIADDVSSERQLIQKVLTDAGHTVVATADGVSALAAVEEHTPDLAILDVVMPGKSGFDVCRAIKKSESVGEVPVILLTSKSQDSDKYWGERQGADEYLTKPFDVEELLAAVTRCG